MAMVQEQRLQLKMKLFLGYKMKIVVLWGDKNLIGDIFSGGERLSKACVDDDGILAKEIFGIKARESSKLLRVFFHRSQPNLQI